MDKKDKEIKGLQNKVDELTKSVEKSKSTGKENIYSPAAQVPFSQYKGTREEYKKEARLRQVASGKKDTFTSQTLRFVTAAVFGDKEIADAVRERFQQTYSKEEVQQAEKQLEKEFGIKKKISEDKLITKKVRKIIKDELSPINTSIAGLQGAIKSVGEDVKRAESAIKSIDKFLVKSITDVITTFAGGRGGELDATPSRMKPATVSDTEGREYLYYPDAPPGRQLYEKSKTGTAGRIASKEVQESLENKLKELDRDTSVKPANIRPAEDQTDVIVSQIKILLEEESMFRKRDMEKLIGDLKENILAKNKSSIFDAEPDEQEQIMAEAMERALDKTLYKALKKVFEDNPDLAGGGGGGILGDVAGGLLGGALGKKIFGKTAEKTAKETAEKAAEKTGAKVAGKTILKSAIKKIPIIGAIAGLGFAASRAASGDFTGAGLEAASGLLGTIPGFGTAASLGIDAALAARDIGALESPEAGALESPASDVKTVVKETKKPNLTILQPNSSIGQNIIDQNQKRIEIQSAKKVEIPAQTVNNFTNNSVIPVPSGKKTIEVHNQENTFNRLLAQEFDHPATYASMNMG